MPDSGHSRWAGRNSVKAAVRSRVWGRLAETGVNVGPAFDRIPNFVGADVAAKRLGELDEWKRARVVKCNPDPPQIPVRLRALYDGKLLFSPVPYLTKGFPYLRSTRSGSPRRASISRPRRPRRASWSIGEPVGFEDDAEARFLRRRLRRGHAAGRADGQGRGFADLEQGVFRELGLVDAKTPIATTVHSSQVVDDGEVVMEAHDSALDYHRDRAAS